MARRQSLGQPGPPPTNPGRGSCPCCVRRSSLLAGSSRTCAHCASESSESDNNGGQGTKQLLIRSRTDAGWFDRDTVISDAEATIGSEDLTMPGLPTGTNS
jgi:hypothetical protein